MGKFFLFSFLWWITGNPFLAILLLLILFYFLDRRFIGLSPSITKPLRQMRRISKLQQELRLNPHHTSNKLELARLYMEKGQYQKALPYLQEVQAVIEDSAEIDYELGLCLVKTERIKEGEALILKALERNPLVKYGEPYLELGEIYSPIDIEKALSYLQKIQEIHSSSAETYYRLGTLYTRLGQRAEAAKAFNEALEIYKSLPKYMRKKQRKWAILSRIKKASIEAFSV
ncbi:lipopolysaccharide assembly protein LapB [Ammoniphilus sp. YIM 78166]|uniref:tetratricopeptide repeat protein n=1 Tax=Ammoniphilus sp. YIM 78166 TaxID=1644106 RepID=UPI00106F2AA7|nr:tetratricopeptide repeat protein [Ammoniphilus sp. YIM 78166]